MNITRLRGILRKRAFFGELYVALYLTAHHLWTKRRVPLAASLLAIVSAGILLCPHLAQGGKTSAVPPALTTVIASAQSTLSGSADCQGPVETWSGVLKKAKKAIALRQKIEDYEWQSNSRICLYMPFEWQGKRTRQQRLCIDLSTGKQRRSSLSPVVGDSGEESAMRKAWNLPEDVSAPNLLGYTKRGTLIIASADGMNWRDIAEPMSLLELKGEHGGIVHRSALTFPINKSLDSQNVALSPDGSRILWVMRYEVKYTGLAEKIAADAERVMAPSMRYDVKYPVCAGGQTKVQVYTFWLSRYDGKYLRQIAELRIPDLPSEKEPDKFYWLPDGRRFSFLYKDSLWIIPIGGA